MVDELNVENIVEVASTPIVDTPVVEVEATYIEKVKELTIEEIEKDIKSLKSKYDEEKTKLEQELEDAKAKIVQEEIKLSEFWIAHRENVIVVLLSVVALKLFGVI